MYKNNFTPPVSSIPDIQPTPPPSPQIPSPSFHDTEGPSFEPSYHMSPPPSHEPEIQASISSEESEQLRNLMDIVPRLESRVKSLEKELSETKQTLGTAILQLIEKVKKLENKLRKKRKSKETKDAEDPLGEKGKEPMTEEDLQAEVQALRRHQRASRSKRKKAAREALAQLNLTTFKSMIKCRSDFAEKDSTRKKGSNILIEERAKFLHGRDICCPKGKFLAEQRSAILLETSHQQYLQLRNSDDLLI
ncbi:hypothetical protein Tco_0655257 [Tanacetum coccineum]|uniref:Uncharacterized protein n=1 Tax=Tanacetum coccineum TaxID=301880 RepID=A0ABQ4X624_9ASTR